MKNAEAVAEILIEFEADVDATDASGDTPMHFCAVHDAEEFADLLLRNGADIDAMNSINQSPLLYAAAFGELVLALT